jgi:choline dehydrogenase
MRYDVIVVGAGSGGSIVASRLSEDPRLSVLLLEAGPDYPTLEELPDELKYGHATGARVSVSERHMWPYVAKATPTAPPMPVPRGRVTGGSSAVNGQIFLRGLPEDYDKWFAEGNDGWGFADVLPVLRSIENDRNFTGELHGNDGPIGVHRYQEADWLSPQRAFREACLSSGFADCPDANEPDSTGVGPYPLNNPDGIRISTALGYLSTARSRPNLTLRPDAVVRRVVFDGPRAIGVEIDSPGGPELVEAAEIVLSGGAIGSPHLLLLSGVGPADQLEPLGIDVVHHLPGVGQNLQDHPMVELSWRMKPAHLLDTSCPRVQIVLRYTAGGSALRNDMWITPLCYKDEFKMYTGIHFAVGRGELRIESKDHTVAPSLDYRYLEEPFDQQRIREAARLGLSLAEDAAFSDIIEARVAPTDDDLSSDDALDAWIQRGATSSQHIACTAKMGPASDPMAVVDQFGRVHGLTHLRVADASIMPNMIRANTNVSTMMIGERIAAFIASEKEQLAAVT